MGKVVPFNSRARQKKAKNRQGEADLTAALEMRASMGFLSEAVEGLASRNMGPVFEALPAAFEIKVYLMGVAGSVTEASAERSKTLSALVSGYSDQVLYEHVVGWTEAGAKLKPKYHILLYREVFKRAGLIIRGE